MKDPNELAAADRVTHVMLAAVLSRLQALEKRLDDKAPHLKAEEAVGMFRQYLEKHTKRPENYDFLLECFLFDFQDRNIAEITAEEIEGFLNRRWKGRPSTFNQRLTQLKGLFNCAIQLQQRRKAPVFHNPCSLVRAQKTIVSEPEFISIPTIQFFLRSVAGIENWAACAIMASGGLRVSEVLKLTPGDLDGRILTIRDPKSGRPYEHAVIPGAVALHVKLLAKDFSENQKIFEATRQYVGKMVQRHGKDMGLKISPHALRKWCATFWQRKGEDAMVAFMLRHASGSLKDRYVAPLTVEEAMVLQDHHMKDVFTRGQ